MIPIYDELKKSQFQSYKSKIKELSKNIPAISTDEHYYNQSRLYHTAFEILNTHRIPTGNNSFVSAHIAGIPLLAYSCEVGLKCFVILSKRDTPLEEIKKHIKNKLGHNIQKCFNDIREEYQTQIFDNFKKIFLPIVMQALNDDSKKNKLSPDTNQTLNKEKALDKKKKRAEREITQLTLTTFKIKLEEISNYFTNSRYIDKDSNDMSFEVPTLQCLTEATLDTYRDIKKVATL